MRRVLVMETTIKEIDNTKEFISTYNLTEDYVKSVNSKYCPAPILIRNAVNKPNEEQEQFSEDKHGTLTYRYRGIIIFDNETNILTVKGNASVRCPNWTGHHLGSTCTTCGLKD